MKEKALAVLLGAVLLVCFASAQADPPRKVDLNTASLKELDTLPGIGPATAERILEFRKKNGPFKRVEDLMNVRGIGERKFLKLKDRITAGPVPATLAPSRQPEP